MSDSVTRKNETENPDLLDDCKVMLRFALKEARNLPFELQHDIALLDRVLAMRKLPPISALPQPLIGLDQAADATPATPTPVAVETVPSATLSASVAPVDAAVPPADVQTPATEATAKIVTPAEPTPSAKASLLPGELVFRVHAGLSAVVAPATALTLQISEPPAGAHRFLGGMPMLVKAASWVAMIFGVGFIITAVPVVQKNIKQDKTNSATKPASGKGASPAPPSNDGTPAAPTPDSTGTPSDKAQPGTQK